MSKTFKGKINVDIKDSVPDWEPYAQPMAPDGAPSILYVVLDDVGFSAMESYGGLIETPNIDRIADSRPHIHELPYDRPMLTDALVPADRPQPHHERHGLHHRSGLRVPERKRPYSWRVRDAAEILGERGWNTYIVGKWHLTAEDEMNLASTKKDWPLGRGFERFYGFLGAETNQWYPDIVYDNHPVDQPSSPEDGYHFSIDITDKAMSFIQDAKAVAPDKPFFLYYALGAAHAPHHVPTEWADKYKGKFDMGYEAYRELVFATRRSWGSSPTSAELSPINPYTDLKGPDGQPWGGLDVVRPWDSLNDDEKHALRQDGGGLCRLPVARRRRSSGVCSTTSSRPASWTTR